MEHKPFTFMKMLLVFLIVVSLIASVLLSLQSVTGYAVSEVVSEKTNLFALVFFLFGLFTALLYLSKFR